MLGFAVEKIVYQRPLSVIYDTILRSNNSGPSSAFEKWSGHERSKTFTSAEGTSRGRAREGHSPCGKGDSGDPPPPPGKILY